ncbi:hypothetical protein OAK19_03160 [Aureispira]|nr:hypothetical protein [Aureispira sp.]
MRLTFLFFFLWFSIPLLAQSDLEVQLEKGINLFNNKKYAKAERIFDRILRIEESYAYAYMWKAKCLLEFKEYKNAYNNFSTAKDLIPDYAPFWFEIGKFKCDFVSTIIKRPELCGECGKLVLPNNDIDVNAFDYYKSAIIDFEKAIDIDSKYGEAYYHIALIYNILGDKFKACNNWIKARDLLYKKKTSPPFKCP